MGNEAFAKRIKKLRNDKGLTMEALGQQLGISKGRISMWENNGVVPRNDVLKLLSEFFGVSTDYLLGNDDMEGKRPQSPTLHAIQRGLNEMDEEQLNKAKNVLSSVFEEIFNDKEQ
ncbi:MAG: helix-turn-helix transcriptional regulator [Atopobium sp.]|nr:helix-turn-helix transcriptional regulator [Atopobium sp.]